MTLRAPHRRGLPPEARILGGHFHGIAAVPDTYAVYSAHKGQSWVRMGGWETPKQLTRPAEERDPLERRYGIRDDGGKEYNRSVRWILDYLDGAIRHPNDGLRAATHRNAPRTVADLFAADDPESEETTPETTPPETTPVTTPPPDPTPGLVRPFALAWAPTDHPDARLVISRDQWYATEAEAEAAGERIGTELFMGENPREHGRIVVFRAITEFLPQSRIQTVRVLARSDLRATAPPDPAPEAMPESVIAPEPPAPAPIAVEPAYSTVPISIVPPRPYLGSNGTHRRTAP